jgi:PAS domain S-box-containing protein
MGAAADRMSKWLTKYLFLPVATAGFFVLVALLWTFLLQHVIAYPFVFLFFAAVIGSAWFGGFIAGAWSVVMSSVLIDFFFLPPLYSIEVGRKFQTYQLAFILCAIAIALICSALRRSEDAVKASRDEMEAKVQERTAELRRSNQEILERERQLRLLTEAIPQQIWRADSNGAIEYCNHDLIEFTGKPLEELCGEKFFDIFHEEDAALFRQGLDAAHQSGSRFEIQARVRDADGNYRWFLIRGVPQRSFSGEVACWYGVHIDIEEQYRAQLAILQAQEDSARWSRTFSMGEMAVSIAHELKQPLTALMTHAQACRRWLRAQPPNIEKASNAAENLVRESTRASAVVDRVRSLLSHQGSVRELSNLNLLIRDVAHLLRDEAIRRDVSIELRLAENLPQTSIDPVQIQQLLLNLAMNGIESMMEAGHARKLTICTELNNAGETVVTVRDYGTGLSEEARKKMFDPFFTTKRQGMGIGLSICRSIVEAHDGRIWAEALAEGTAFHFVLGRGE